MMKRNLSLLTILVVNVIKILALPFLSNKHINHKENTIYSLSTLKQLVDLRTNDLAAIVKSHDLHILTAQQRSYFFREKYKNIINHNSYRHWRCDNCHDTNDILNPFGECRAQTMHYAYLFETTRSIKTSIKSIHYPQSNLRQDIAEVYDSNSLSVSDGQENNPRIQDIPSIYEDINPTNLYSEEVNNESDISLDHAQMSNVTENGIDKDSSTEVHHNTKESQFTIFHNYDAVLLSNLLHAMEEREHFEHCNFQQTINKNISCDNDDRFILTITTKGWEEITTDHNISSSRDLGATILQIHRDDLEKYQLSDWEQNKDDFCSVIEESIESSRTAATVIAYLTGIIFTLLFTLFLQKCRQILASYPLRALAWLEYYLVSQLDNEEYSSVILTARVLLPIVQVIYGKAHRNTSGFKHYLARALLELEDDDHQSQLEAISLLRSIIVDYEVYGQDLYYARAREDLARAYRKSRQSDDSMQEYLLALKVYVENYNAKRCIDGYHPMTVITVNNDFDNDHGEKGHTEDEAGLPTPVNITKSIWSNRKSPQSKFQPRGDRNTSNDHLPEHLHQAMNELIDALDSTDYDSTDDEMNSESESSVQNESNNNNNCSLEQNHEIAVTLITLSTKPFIEIFSDTSSPEIARVLIEIGDLCSEHDEKRRKAGFYYDHAKRILVNRHGNQEHEKVLKVVEKLKSSDLL